jgi:hypothetical protein
MQTKELRMPSTTMDSVMDEGLVRVSPAALNGLEMGGGDMLPGVWGRDGLWGMAGLWGFFPGLDGGMGEIGE